MTESNDREYKGRSEYLGAFGVAGVFTLVGILGIAFLILDIDFMGLKSWGYYMFIPAFFIWIGGIVSLTKQQRLQREVLAAWVNYQGGPVKVEALLQDVMMDRESLMRLLIDLRTSGRIKFRVDSNSGEIIIGEAFMSPKPEVSESTLTKTMFCPQCGTKMDATSTFCPNCGSSVK